MLDVTSQGTGESKLNSRNIVAAIIVVTVGLIVWAWYSNPLIVTVTGSGEVDAKPEIATVSFVTSSSSPNVNDAIELVNSKQTQIVQALASYGIAEADIVQSQVDVIPPALLGTGATNYSATITTSVDVNDYSNASSLMAFLYGNGVSYVSQPVLSVRDSKTLEDQALDLAMKDASSKASSVALKNWKLLKKKVAITQTTSSPSASATTKTTQADQTTQIQVTGDSFKVATLVSVTYKMW
jgi:hypothetical protein